MILNMMYFLKPIKYRLQILSRYFPFSNIIKKHLLKLILNDQEKLFFSLLAPNDGVGTEADIGYLIQIGWYASLQEEFFHDNEGDIIPWLTYPATAFLKQRLQQELFVFEYGAGGSTLFFAQRVNEIHSVEHQPEWYHQIQTKSKENVFIYLTELDYNGNYHKFPLNLQKFHVILIDGRDRVRCCQVAPKALRPDGVIILDDSQRSRYKVGIQYLLEQGFKQIPFYGLRPKATQDSCTTIFYKPGNCLNI